MEGLNTLLNVILLQYSDGVTENFEINVLLPCDNRTEGNVWSSLLQYSGCWTMDTTEPQLPATL